MKMQELAKKGIVKGIVIFLIGVFIGSVSSPACSVEEHEGLKEKVTTLTSEKKELQAKVDEAAPYFKMKEEEKLAMEEANKKAEEERKQKELEAKSVELSNGNFVAGSDFEAGTYDLVAVSGGGNVSSDNMYSGGLNAIMGTANDGFYQKEYKNIKLPEGTTLKIDGVTIKLIPKE